jgi:hypothetical protein
MVGVPPNRKSSYDFVFRPVFGSKTTISFYDLLLRPSFGSLISIRLLGQVSVAFNILS